MTSLPNFNSATSHAFLMRFNLAGLLQCVASHQPPGRR